MNIFITILEIYAITLTSLVLIVSPGLWLLSKVQTRLIVRNVAVRITFSFTLGFAVLESISFLVAKSHVSVRAPFELYMLLGVITLILLFKRNNIQNALVALKTLALASLVGVWQFLPGIVKSNPSGAGLNMIVHVNNDVASYAEWTNEFLKSGFHSDGHLASIDLNSFALTTAYHGPTTLIALVASVFHLPTWQVMLPVIGIGIAISTLSLNRLIQAFFPTAGELKALILSATIMMTSLLTYVQLNYFLGEVLALAVSAIMISNVIEFVQYPKSRKILLVEVIALVVLGFYTYPALLLPLMILSFIFMLTLWLVQYKFSHILALMSYFAAGIVGLIASLPYASTAIRLMKELSDGHFGWSLPPLNPGNILLFPDTIGSGLNSSMTVVIWLFTTTLLCYFFFVSPLNSKQKRLPLFVCFSVAISVIVVTLARNQGFAAYDSWKLIAYTYPIFLAAALPFIFLQRKHATTIVMIMFVMSISSSILLWNTSTPTFVSHDLASLAKNRNLERLKTLNVQIDPNFETMAAANIIKGPVVYLNSVSYYPVSSDQNSCTLVHLNNSLFPFVERLNSTYGLASTLKNACSAKEVGVKFGNVLMYNSTHLTPNGTGWSPPEAWGTWTVEKSASLKIPINLKQRSDLHLQLISSAFLGSTGRFQTVEVLVNSVLVGRANYSSAENEALRTFKISRNLLKIGEQDLQIQFKVSSPMSPKALGISSDPRMLGLGLISVRIIEN